MEKMYKDDTNYTAIIYKMLEPTTTWPPTSLHSNVSVIII